MLRQNYDLPGSPYRLTVLRFGEAGTGKKAYVQAGLHADEFPGMLVLRILAGHLAEADTRGAVHSEILLVPQSNPIGLAQTETSFLSGRLESGTGKLQPELCRAVRPRKPVAGAGRGVER